jgi:ParB-like chromosome segregation protein Spo0J
MALIDIGDRRRAIDPVWAEGLSGLMRRHGQLTPIEVCRADGGRLVLVTGAHRFAAASLLAWTEINAIVVSSEMAERQLREISENLFRRDLDPADRAADIADLIELTRVADGSLGKSAQQVAAEARWAPSTVKKDALDASVKITDAYGWSDKVAERLGVSRSTVEKNLLLYRRLSPQVKAMLAGHPQYRNASAMHALAKLEAEQQLQVAEMLASGAIKGVGEGVATLQQRPKASAEERRLSAMLGAISRMGKAERQGAFDQLAGQYMHELVRAISKAQLAAEDIAA